MGVSDGPHAGQTVLVRVTVLDENDNFPSFQRSLYAITVDEVKYIFKSRIRLTSNMVTIEEKRTEPASGNVYTNYLTHIVLQCLA